jgi:hypothetical protein
MSRPENRRLVEHDRNANRTFHGPGPCRKPKPCRLRSSPLRREDHDDGPAAQRRAEPGTARESWLRA